MLGGEGCEPLGLWVVLGLCCLVPSWELSSPKAMRGHREFTLTWSLNLFPLTKIYFLKKHDILAVVEMARFALVSPSDSGASALVLVRCFPWLARSSLLLSSFLAAQLDP